MDIASGRADVGDNGCARGGEPQAKISKIYRDSGSTVARSAINYRNITIYNNGAGGGGRAGDPTCYVTQEARAFPPDLSRFIARYK